MAEYFPIDVSSLGSYSGSFSGSFQGNGSRLTGITASYLSGSVTSASYAATASYLLGSVTSASYALSASYAATASYSTTTSNILVYVKNQTGFNIAKGVVVRITGSGNSSDIPRITTASYENDNNSANTLGITNGAITNGSEGYVMTEGVLIGIDTSAFTSGQLVYLGATGSIIGYAPVAPLHAVRLGEVVRSQLNNGSIYVRIDNGYELDELHNVKITTASLSSGDLLVYSSSVWVNTKQLTGSYELTGSLNVSGSITGTASYATRAGSAAAVDVFSFSSPVESYLLMSNVVATTGVAIGGDTDLRYNASTNVLTVPNVSATTLTASNATISGNVTVLGTASINNLVVNQIGYSSGSNQLGDAANDTQTLYGSVIIPTGSLTVTGSISVNGRTGTGLISVYGDVGSTLRLNVGSSNPTKLQFTQEFTPGTPTEVGFVQNEWGTGTTLSTFQDIIFKPGNTERARIIGANGNFVIGATSSLARLQVRGSGTTNATTALRVENSSASPSLIVLDNGYIGIGTGSAAYNLDVSGSTRVSGTTTLSGAVAVNSTNVSTGYALYVNGVIGATSLTLTQNLTMGENYAISNNGSQTIDIDANNDSTNAVFRVTANGTANELFRVNETGSFMIGTTTDSGFKLDVSGSGRFTNGLTVTGSLIAPSITGSLQGTASWANRVLTASVAGNSTNIQYNSNGVLAGSDKFTYNGSILQLTGSLIISGTYGGVNTSINKPALYDSNNIARVSWVVGALVDASNSASVDWQNRYLQDSSETARVDWQNGMLNDSAGSPSIDWESRTLAEPTGAWIPLQFDNDIHTTSQLYHRSNIAPQVQRSLSDTPTYAGQTIQATFDASVVDYDLVSLATDGIWYRTKATAGYGADKMLGIAVDIANGYVLLEGDIGVSDDDSQGAYVVGAGYGLPVYVSGNTSEMTTTAPTGGIVRIVGHIYYQSTTDTNWWTMKFRPSNDWYEI